MQLVMSKKEHFKELTLSHNPHFNFRWHCYIDSNTFAAAPSSVQLVWSLLLLASDGMFIRNPFQSRDAIWHHTFNSVFICYNFLGLQGLTLSSPKIIVAFFGLDSVNPCQPKIL
jgi:hypothetical protein